jgi:hypothetical protein
MQPSVFSAHRRLSVALAIAALLACVGSAQAQSLTEAYPLKVGQFRWASDDGLVGDLSIVVSIAQQRVYVYRAGRLIAMSTVSTGMAGHRTPLGDFTVLQKQQWHRSNIYSNAPMPYMQRLTWSGIALHGGHLPGYPASHGCIRLPLAFARQLFAVTSLGVPVTIVDAHRQPLVKLHFADIEWLAGDDALSTPPARITPADFLVDEEVMPPAPARNGPHWAPRAEIEAVRSGRATPRLEFEPVPE